MTYKTVKPMNVRSRLLSQNKLWTLIRQHRPRRYDIVVTHVGSNGLCRSDDLNAVVESILNSAMYVLSRWTIQKVVNSQDLLRWNNTWYRTCTCTCTILQDLYYLTIVCSVYRVINMMMMILCHLQWPSTTRRTQGVSVQFLNGTATQEGYLVPFKVYMMDINLLQRVMSGRWLHSLYTRHHGLDFLKALSTPLTVRDQDPHH